ncbi:MAG: class I SAM-dependent methyltransferase [Firmicutes bacterium]|nr:class I SAM-dependent methyltransferase [Bacillota bacterium]
MDYVDVLAMVGAGTAHPGGEMATRAWLAQLHLTSEDRVLEVGCGTGRTACEIARRWPCSVTAVDTHAGMIDRARERAARRGVAVDFRKARGGALPFPDQAFTVVTAESVAVFNRIQPLLRDWHRVLKAGGTAIDTEMCAGAPLPAAARRTFASLYGVREVPTLATWKGEFERAGFGAVRVLQSGPASGLAGAATGPAGVQPDTDSQVGADLPPQAVEVLRQNAEAMAAFAPYLQFVTILAKRAE